MIEKLDLLKMFNERQTEGQWNKAVETTINLLIDAVNKLETMARNTNTVLESLVQENNIHEKQIDELQMKLEPEKCETPAENVQPDAESRPENVQKEALTMALEALHAIAHWGPWKDDREEYAEKAHKKICELLTKGDDNE